MEKDISNKELLAAMNAGFNQQRAYTDQRVAESQSELRKEIKESETSIKAELSQKIQETESSLGVIVESLRDDISAVSEMNSVIFDKMQEATGESSLPARVERIEHKRGMSLEEMLGAA